MISARTMTRMRATMAIVRVLMGVSEPLGMHGDPTPFRRSFRADSS
jgi:hypothetical protein